MVCFEKECYFLFGRCVHIYSVCLLDNQTYFDPHAMENSINSSFPKVTQQTHTNGAHIVTQDDVNGHYEMQSSAEIGHESEMENYAQPGHVYEMGNLSQPTATAEAHEIHYVCK